MEKARAALRQVRESISQATPDKMMLCVVSSFGCVLGVSGQIVSLNQCVATLQKLTVGGPMTILLSSSLISLLLFLVFAVLYVVYYKIQISPIRACLSLFKKKKTKRSKNNRWFLFYCCLGGFVLGIQSILVVFSTPKVSETAQSLLMSTLLLDTLVLSAVFNLSPGRSYCNLLVLVSVVFTVLGVIVGFLGNPPSSSSSSSSSNSTNSSTSSSSSSSGTISEVHHPALFTILFAIGVALAGAQSVIAAKMMIRCTFDPSSSSPTTVPSGSSTSSFSTSAVASQEEENEENENENEGGSSQSNNNKEKDSKNMTEIEQMNVAPLLPPSSNICSSDDDDHEEEEEEEKEDDNNKKSNKKIQIGVAKVAFLVLSTFFQCLTLVILLPLDFLAGFGPYSNASDAMDALNSGFSCVFNAASAHSSCSEAALYLFLFVAFLNITNASFVTVSSFSAPLCTLLAQCGTSIVVVLILILPDLAPVASKANPGLAVLSFLLILVGGFFFSFWEILGEHEQKEQQQQDEGHARESENNEDDNKIIIDRGEMN